MTTINLYQNQEETQRKISARTANSGFWFSLAILILTLIALFGIRMYVASLVKNNEMLLSNIASENKRLAGVDSLQRVIDMQTRLLEINKNLAIKDGTVNKMEMTEILDEVEKNMNSGAVIASYTYNSEANDIDVSFQTHNFNDSARQILNFKKSEYFNDVALENISRNEKNITAEMIMKIKGY